MYNRLTSSEQDRHTGMYIISNSDLEYAIKYIELMAETLPDTGLRNTNNVRMARILVKKLRAKQPFAASVLPDDIRRILHAK